MLRAILPVRLFPALLIFLSVVPSAPAQESPDFSVITCTIPWLPFDKQQEQIEQVLEKNPYVSGVGIRGSWRLFNPEENTFELDQLRNLVGAIAARDRWMYLCLVPGGKDEPEWIYEQGARPFLVQNRETDPTRMGLPNSYRDTPVPWDPVYTKYWLTVLEKIAPIVNAEKKVVAVNVQGHNSVLEMHMPSGAANMEEWKKLGWTPEIVVENWKSWIDDYARLFPEKKLIVTISALYGNEPRGAIDSITDYAVAKYGSRVVFMNYQIQGRFEYMTEDNTQCRPMIRHKETNLAGLETLRSYAQDPQRYGSMDMVMLNLKKVSPWFVQVWNRDALLSPEYCKELLDTYDRYQGVTYDELKARLQAAGKYYASRAEADQASRPSTQPLPDGQLSAIYAEYREEYGKYNDPRY